MWKRRLHKLPILPIAALIGSGTIFYYFVLLNKQQTVYEKYPKRKNMEDCPAKFGRVAVFVGYTGNSTENLYEVAQQSLRCYLKGTHYSFFYIDLDNDKLVQSKCRKHGMVFFKKHCAASIFLPQTDWMLVLDADTGVINPNHCIEEWIDDRVAVILYERFFNWEIMAGNYLVKNSYFGIKFLNEWANSEFHLPYSFHGNDQGPLMMLLLKFLIPGSSVEYNACKKYWNNATNVNTYLAMVYCVRQALGATKIWPDKVRIFRKFHAFARDDALTDGRWCEADFMFHGWKRVEQNQIFEKNIDLNLCDQGMKAWKWKNKKLSVRELRTGIESAENFYRTAFPKEAEIHPFLNDFKISDCYPDCDKFDVHL